MPRPSPYWGSEPYWYDPAITNHAVMDSKGRVWMSSRFRRPENQPDFCRNHPSAALAQQESSFRQVQYFDPRTQSFTPVNICFDTHHVQFAADADETLYANGVFSGAIGWINTRILDETGDEAAAQSFWRQDTDKGPVLQRTGGKLDVLINGDKVDAETKAAVEAAIAEVLGFGSRVVAFRRRFIAESPRRLRALHAYFVAVAGAGEFPAVRCNAPEFSAVVDTVTGAVASAYMEEQQHIYGEQRDARRTLTEAYPAASPPGTFAFHTSSPDFLATLPPMTFSVPAVSIVLPGRA